MSTFVKLMRSDESGIIKIGQHDGTWDKCLNRDDLFGLELLW